MFFWKGKRGLLAVCRKPVLVPSLLLGSGLCSLTCKALRTWPGLPPPQGPGPLTPTLHHLSAFHVVLEPACFSPFRPRFQCQLKKVFLLPQPSELTPPTVLLWESDRLFTHLPSFWGEGNMSYSLLRQTPAQPWLKVAHLQVHGLNGQSHREPTRFHLRSVTGSFIHSASVH